MLKTIYELALTVPNDLDEGQLIHDPDTYRTRPTYCAVGWMCHEAGMTDEEIKELDENDIMYLHDKVGTLYGLTREQVEFIIYENDKGYKSMDERQRDVQCALLTIIGQECA